MSYEAIWRMLYEIKYAYYYSEFYYDRFSKIDRVINYVSTLLSLAPIVTLGIDKLVPFAWAILVAVVQGINSIRPQFPYIKFMNVLPLYSKDMNALYVECHEEFLKLDKDNKEQCIELQVYMESALDELDSKYFSNGSMPDIKKLQTSAMEASNQDMGIKKLEGNK